MTAALSPGQQRSLQQFYIHIEGLPRAYTWQDLKDLIRGRASHGIFTEMAKFASGQPAGCGFARVQRSEEAINLYQYLTCNKIEGRRLTVHLWDTSQSPPHCISSNCSPHACTHAHGNAIARLAVEPIWHRVSASPMPPHPVTPYQMMGTAPCLPVSASLVPAPQPAMPIHVPFTDPNLLAMDMANLGLNPRDPSHRAYVQQKIQASRQDQYPKPAVRSPTTYATASSGAPINTTHGFVVTETRGVFVGNLSYKARTRDVEQLFRKAGEVVNVEMLKDFAGRFKGSATVLYETADAMRTAVEMFDELKFMNFTLKVRPDREATPVAARRTPATPVIVNGSLGQARKDSAVFYK